MDTNNFAVTSSTKMYLSVNSVSKAFKGLVTGGKKKNAEGMEINSRH
jgi:hypothetical protein